MTRSDSPPALPSPAAPPIPSSTPHPIDRLYRWLASDRVLVVVAVLVVTPLLVSLLLPQLPADRGEPDAAARWLAETAAQFNSLGNLMAGVGLFNLWNSLWFQALVGLLAFVLLLRLGLAIGNASRRLRRPDPRAAASEAQRWLLHAAVQLEQEAGSAGLQEDLTSEGWRVVSLVQGDNVLIVAERSRVGIIAPILVIGGLLVVVAGLWLGQLVGWQESGLILAPGEAVTLANLPGSALSASPDADGVLSEVSIKRATGQPATTSFSTGGTAHHAGGLTIYRRAQGPALAVSAAGPAGDALQLQPMEAQSSASSSLTLVFDQPRSEQVFLLPDRQLVLSIVSFPALPERGFAGPTFLVQAFRAGQREPLLNEFVDGDASLSIGQDTLQLRAGQFITVDVRNDPIRPLIWLGAALAVLGVALALWRPAGQIFLSVQRERGHVAVQASLDPAWSWREASRWLTAWAATYDQQEDQTP